MSQHASNISTSPGLILRTAREEQKLSIDRVAHELHLRSSVVQAMEKEDYDSFSSDVFLKGYFRSYCRLVNLHEERMVELLDTQLCSRRKEIESEVLNEKKAKQAKVRKKLTGIVAVLAVIAGLSVYVLGYLLSSEPKENSVSSPVADNELAASDTSLDVPVNEEVNSNASSPMPDTLGTSSNDDITTADSTSNAAETIAKEKIGESVLDSQSQYEVAKNAEIARQAVSTETPLAPHASFEASFIGDCWFKFTNGEGKNVFAALKKAGQKVKYTGPMPFTVIFGDAKQVTVTFEGSVVDLTPHTAKNGRAQIVLNLDD